MVKGKADAVTPNNAAYDSRTAVVILSLYRKLSGVCQSTGDMDPAEYGILLSVSEHDQGIEMRALRKRLAFFPDALGYLSLLESKELIERKRSSTDRRAFAYEATMKGLDRAHLVDDAIARVLVGSTPRITEERFSHLIETMHKAVLDNEAATRIVTLFPATAILGLCALQSCMLEVGSVAGMPTAAFAILQIVLMNDNQLTADDIAAKIGVPAAIIEVFTERMNKRHWLRVDRYLSLTETGRQKGEAVAERLAQRIPLLYSQATLAQREVFERVTETCLYLFG